MSSVLPYNSRKAAKRVKDKLPAPTECRYCGKPVILNHNSAVYGSEFGNWPYVYMCTGCDAYVGVHPHTDIPLGTLADRLLRSSRKTSKNTFSLLLQMTGSNRDSGYAWLAKKLGIPQSNCHFGWFEDTQCAEVIKICREALKAVPASGAKINLNDL